MENLGLSKNRVKELRELYGKNELPAPERDAWYSILLDKFKDPLIIVLLIAAAISGVLGIIEGSFVETIGIVCAILIATLVAFWSDLSSQKKFDALNSLNQAVKVMVRRAEGIEMIDQRDLVPGDIVILKQGEEIPADCKIIESINLHVNESSLTGESVPAEKGINLPQHGAYAGDFLLKSTIITEGTTTAIVVATGERTEIGKVARESALDLDEKTPLTKQLDGLGDLITKAAFSIAGLLVLCLCAAYYFKGGYVGKDGMAIANDILQYFMIAITLVVVAVPEGLPMAVVISLSHSMKKLIKDNNLIKNLHACETMGAVSVIVTDKTGTLTENKMVVKDFKVNGIDENLDNFIGSLIINNSAEIDSEGAAIGNPTDAALLTRFLLGEKPVAHSVIPFTSDTKCMQSTYNDVTYVKGAIEVIAKMSEVPERFFEYAESEASKGNRVIATMQITSDQILFLGCVSIEDPIRKDVPAAIKECRDAGIKVIMATGDNIVTATEIGKQAGIDADNV
ncbi:MAG: HAD-IC family P-type ATPase, partial [Turicibacter sp.]